MVTRSIAGLAFALLLTGTPIQSVLAEDSSPPASAPVAGRSLAGQPGEPSLSRPFEGLSTDAPFTPTGTAELARDGLSLVDGPARPCGEAAHETDGTTTCIGIPPKRRH
jgi:hypothetical protein